MTNITMKHADGLIDTEVERTFATGIAGFSHVVDSFQCDQICKSKSNPR